jgi:hypothetical protein
VIYRWSRRLALLVGGAAVGLVLVTVSVVAYYGTLNVMYGASTEYHDPSIKGAARQADGRYVAYLGDRIYVTYEVKRHKINGDCLLDVFRYAEEVGGPRAGTRHLINHVELRFVGKDEIVYPSWPIDGLVLGESLMSPDVDEQALDLYVVAKYRCNPLDDWIDRYIQGGAKPNETARVTLILRRRRQ